MRLHALPGRPPLGILLATIALAACGKDASAPTATLTSLTAVGWNVASAVAGGTAGRPTVEARDQNGRPMAGVSVRFTVGGGGALSDTVLSTGADGRVATTWILGASPAVPQSVRATAGTLAAEFTTSATEPTPGTTYASSGAYIEYIAGDLPIIITAPHGGTLEPAEIPKRTGTAITTVRDSNTEELARTIGNIFATKTGGRPHIIIVRLRRTKLDANRDLTEAALGNRLAGRAWIEFHSFVEAAKQSVIAHHGTGFYIDLHGHGHAIPRLELGYLLASGMLAQSDAELNAGSAEDASSIRTLSEASPASFSGILRGPTSLGALFEEAGFPAVPSASTPGPGNAEYFNGGYNTDRYGSRHGGPISGVQIETNFDGVRDNAASRERFATALVTVMSQYIAAHRGPVSVP